MLVTVNGFPGVLRVGDLEIAVSISDRRKSVRLTVERDASVTAVAPPQVSRDELVAMVEAKRAWLYSKLAEHRDFGEDRPAREYVAGEGFPYLGRSYRLRIVEPGSEVRLIRGRLELNRGGGARELVRWYCRVGEPWLKRRIATWASRMGLEVTSLRVQPLGYRWGSCSREGRINIHWATMQLPPTLIDYVLVHEVAHMLQPHHSNDFWRLVERTMPDYQQRRERLRRLGPDLWLPDVEG
jgi:predicted metal-dependent hydrolase